MDSPQTSHVPLQMSVRCLFPQEQAFIPNANTQPVPVRPQATRFSVTNIIKVPNPDDSLSSDDSGTDNLKDDMSDPDTQSALVNMALVKHESSLAHSGPLISEYSRPAMSFYHAPPPASFTSLHTQLPPVMVPSTYPGFFPYRFPVFPHLQPHAMTLQHPINTSRVLSSTDGSDDEGNGSDSRSCSPPSNRDQTSPADSFNSSGVYSNPSPVPSPVPSPCETFHSVPSPVKSPLANRRPRAPGGRTCYVPNQVRVMENAFMENKYPDYDVLEKMSAELEIPVKKIKVHTVGIHRNTFGRCECTLVHHAT